MKQVDNIAAQGDILLVRVEPEKVPASFNKEEKGRLILAHSETGHHHAIDPTDGASVFRDPANPNVCYLMLDGLEHVDLAHHRTFDTHETLRLLGNPDGKACYEVRRQNEYTPSGWRQVQD